jgi:hypothetical protein
MLQELKDNELIVELIPNEFGDGHIRTVTGENCLWYRDMLRNYFSYFAKYGRRRKGRLYFSTCKSRIVQMIEDSLTYTKGTHAPSILVVLDIARKFRHNWEEVLGNDTKNPALVYDHEVDQWRNPI